MLTIYSDNISTRLTYVAEVIFEDILDCPIHLTQDKASLSDGAAVNYSNEEIEGVPFIRPHSLLFETGVRKLSFNMDSSGDLFPSSSDICDQDIFAAIFFHISRYEEYLPHEKDDFGRAKAKDSILFKTGLLETPVVDQWAIELYKSLKKRFPHLPPSQREFQVIPTFDVDVAYAYKGRGWWRKTRSWGKDVLTLKGQRLKERKSVLKGENADPYDSYSYQNRICEQAHARPHHFFLLGNYGKYDKNLSHKQAILQELIRDVSGWSSVGIHPSIGSHESERRLKKEIKRLRKITSNEVISSRQHYLKLELPLTYQLLIQQGIRSDYSMGYADQVGFRAGTCSPYRWYDLSNEKGTELYLFPTMVMDSTLKDYMSLNLEKATAKMKSLRKAVEEVNGVFVILWHNHSAARQGEWNGWRSVLEAGLFS